MSSFFSSIIPNFGFYFNYFLLLYLWVANIMLFFFPIFQLHFNYLLFMLYFFLSHLETSQVHTIHCPILLVTNCTLVYLVLFLSQLSIIIQIWFLKNPCQVPPHSKAVKLTENFRIKNDILSLLCRGTGVKALPQRAGKYNNTVKNI